MMSRNMINSQSGILDALKYIDEAGTSFSTLFVVDRHNKLMGTLTDGDIRRGLLKGVSINDHVDVIMHKTFKHINIKDLANYTGQLQEFRTMNIRFVPVLDEKGILTEVIDLDGMLDVLPLDAFILAGGKGERLFPVTREIPKPLILIGDKPIIGHNVSRMVRYGIKNIYLSVNYLASQIKDYFGDGSSYHANIKYVVEDQPMGTLGSISLISDELNDEVLVMNSDLLTNIDLSDFYQSYKNSKADMAVAVKPFYQDFPYAVIESDENNYVTRLQEKPRYSYYTNAGIYIIKKHLLATISKGERLDATEFIEKMVDSGIKVFSYPIISYWLDIGKPEDLLKAREDIKHLQI